MSEMTQTHADVRGRIIRASILPIEDEETMIAWLRAGAEAVERGELDVDDFVGVWSQCLRELFRRASSVPAPADVRERVARELAGHRQNYDGPDWYDYEEADRIIALLRASRGDGEAARRDGAPGEEPVAWICEVQTEDGDWIYMRTLLSRVEVNEWSERFGRPVRVRVRPLYDQPDDAAGSGEGGSNGLE